MAAVSGEHCVGRVRGVFGGAPPTHHHHNHQSPPTAAAAAAEAHLCVGCGSTNAADTACGLTHSYLCAECLVSESSAAGYPWNPCPNPTCALPLPTPEDIALIAISRRVERGGEPTEEQKEKSRETLDGLRARASEGAFPDPSPSDSLA